MRTYGQYCPIARASEILAERWTPIIMRNVHLGNETFTEIARGAPGLSKTVLSTRLKQLVRTGMLDAKPNPSGRGSRYVLTDAGRELWDVLMAMGNWGERWLELSPQHLDPGDVLWSWCSNYLEFDQLPRDRVVVRFEFSEQPREKRRFWFIFHGEESEVCRTDPGFDEDLVVSTDVRTLTEWHLGRVEWIDAVRGQKIRVRGPRPIARQLPGWNTRSIFSNVEPVSS